MSSISIKDFLKQQNYVRKFRAEKGIKYTLVYGSAEVLPPFDEKDKPSLKVIVRDRSDNEVKAWVTRSMSTLDKLANLEPGDVFELTKKSVNMGGRIIMGYDVNIIGKDK